jgi:hypothetical protein
MILQALHDYYRRLVEENRVAGQGFQEKEIPFVIVLDAKGAFVDLEDTCAGEGRNRRARHLSCRGGSVVGHELLAERQPPLGQRGLRVLGVSTEDPATRRRSSTRASGRQSRRASRAARSRAEAVLRFLRASDSGGVLARPR